MQFTGQSEEVTDIEESGVSGGSVFGWGRMAEWVWSAQLHGWRGADPAGPHLPGLPWQGRPQPQVRGNTVFLGARDFTQNLVCVYSEKQPGILFS